jgi:hypothetical protein
MAIALSVALIITCAVAAVIVTPQAGLPRDGCRSSSSPASFYFPVP